MTQTTAILTQVGEKGEIMIPTEMLQAMRLEENRQINLELRDGEIVVWAAHQRIPLDEVRRRFRQGKGEGMSNEKIDTFIREMRGSL